ncbi:peptidase [Cohnella kolymensis]|uniref:peptidase n=1 Tax=Cohnella kolymensis TaxID=1590652 RepID=UPI000B0E5B55|nr:peptidase [Cohnella kolymensis]
MGIIILDEIVVNRNRVDYFFSAIGNITKYFNPNHHMFLEYNHDISDVPISILTIPFVANVIPLVWMTDSTLNVDELDRSFYECLNKIRLAYQCMFPSVRFKGNLEVDYIVANSYTPEVEAASLFSGGLDALTTFIRIKDKKPMLITEYGWHQDDVQFSEVWDADKKNAESFAQLHGLTNIFIQSNYGTFIADERVDRDFSKSLGVSWWQGLHHGMAFLSAAMPIAFKFKVNCIYIASSLHIGHIAKCSSDPTVDNEMKFASGSVFHDAYELTRQQKVKVVVDYYSVTKEPVSIRVCFKKEQNCCKCEKCIRTILGIIAEGKNPQDFGFNTPENLSQHVYEFLVENVKYLPPDLIIMVWNLIKKRMAENYDNVLYKDFDWFLHYDLAAEQRKSLLHYRVTKFFPILKRKISDRIHSYFAQNT